VAGKNTKLLSRINVWCCRAARDAGDVRVVVIDSVNQKIVVAFALAVDAEAAESGLRLSYSGGQQYQTIRVATEQREIHDILVVAQRRELLVVGIELCRDIRGGGNDNSSSRSAYWQCDVCFGS